MAAQVNSSYALWQQGTNPLLEAYRAYVDRAEVPSKLLLLKGVAHNALATVGAAFAALFSCAWNAARGRCPKVANWTQAKSYWQLTCVGFKALWQIEASMESLRLIESLVCLKAFLKASEASQEDLKANILVLFQNLTATQQQEFVSQLIRKLTATTDETLVLDIIRHLRKQPQKTALNPLLARLAECGKLLIISPAEELWLMNKEALQAIYPGVIDDAEFEHSFSESQGNLFQEGLRLKAQEALAVLRPVHFLFQDNAPEGTQAHGDLQRNIFFVSLLKKSTHPKLTSFLNSACCFWANSILQDQVRLNVRDMNLLFHIDRPELNVALYLYLLAHSPLSSLHEIQPRLNANKDAILAKLFDENDEHMKLNRAAIFIRLLSLHLEHAKPGWQPETIIDICKCGEPFLPLLSTSQEPAAKLAADEFAQVWKAFPMGKHFEVCAALYRCHLTDSQGKSMLPGLELIPQIAYATFKQPGTISLACEDIIAQYVSLLPMWQMANDNKQPKAIKLCFDFLGAANQRQLSMLKQSCVQKIIEGRFHLENSLTDAQRQLFAATLQEYSGPHTPDPQCKDPYLDIKDEALSILNFATCYPAHKSLCINYLKSKIIYYTAAQHYLCASSPEELKTLAYLYAAKMEEDDSALAQA